MHGVYLDVTYKVSLTFKYNYHLHKTIPLREHFLTVKETVTVDKDYFYYEEYT